MIHRTRQPIRAPLLVEFIGVTGSGKSTICRVTESYLRESGLRVMTPFEAGLVWWHLPRIAARRPLARSLLLDIMSAPPAIAWGLRHPRFASSIAVRTVQTIRSPLLAANVLRNVSKRAGQVALLRRAPADVVLIDEGFLHQAHSLFVEPGRPPALPALDRFLERVPLPDLAVLVHAPLGRRVDVIRDRGHTRISSRDHAHVERFLGHAEEIFQHIAASPRLRGRTIHLMNHTLGDEAIAAHAHTAAAAIIDALRARASEHA